MMRVAAIASVLSLALLAHPVPAENHTQPAYAVGDTVPARLKVADGYPGIDLPTLGGETCYVRTNEFIYTIRRDTREVIEVWAVSDVLIW
ncbi:hypothetical protein SAMN04488020_101511 [Palleronia marisminoris]|uniref:Uncharacterized protein n=1 Tax=Palleronia marisminoris TaxID=315423 RepID=A0A1Y5RHQ8_9RHOB|nr:hypothetical protein [Palleronia marisminoris]SFG20766.1 hypothetical protein SAMN04488020_101511 [Palleronia marisminoris]SLN17367.1 hypothetical protein PAM7066_00511 [Palleronia marisminoris]